MLEIDEDALIEVAPGEQKRIGDSTPHEIVDAAHRLTDRKVNRAIERERAAGNDLDEEVITSRAIMQLTPEEQNLVAYAEVIKVIQDELKRAGGGE